MMCLHACLQSSHYLYHVLLSLQSKRDRESSSHGKGGIAVCVLGKGGDREQLEIPQEIDMDVEYAENARLPYPVSNWHAWPQNHSGIFHTSFLVCICTQAFWGRIYHSLALVPAFGLAGLNGLPVYYESRISSTIIASLITGEHLNNKSCLIYLYI